MLLLITFFAFQNNVAQDVQLFVEGIDLVDLDFFTVSDPMCSLRVRESNKDYEPWTSAGETEVIDNNLNPKWINHFTVGYMF